jgi:serine/threonine protein kinase
VNLNSSAAGDDEVFHDAMEEEEKVDLSRPYEHQRINSFPSSVSSLTKNLSGCAEDHTASTSGMTPSRGSVQAEPFRGHETPHEVQLHFQLDAAQCSPIPGIPEEDGDVSSKSHAHSSGKLKPRSHASASSTGSASTKSSRPLPDMSAFVEGTVSSRDRSTDSVRPMPDMTAFDGCHSSRDRSTDESRGTLSSGKSHPPSPKLLCPPTPVRTPAWAHSESKGHPIFKAGGGHPKYTRANSLIATKVLATCSPQVLEGRASLENSMGEDSKAGIRSYQSDSVSTIAEADLPDSDTEEMVEDRKASPTKEGGDKNLDWLHTAPPQALDALDMNAETAPPAVGSVSMGTCFDILSTLGSGTFADVYKVKSRVDGRLYAVKRHRRQFRGRRDREAAMSEVRCMQRLQTSAQGTNEKANYSFYLLFFFQAWQEEGHFFCQTELCCRDTCREMMDSLRSQWNVAKTRYPSIQRLPPPPGIVAGSEADVEGRWVPESTVWKICHDVAAGLSHIHSHGLVHNDIKLANIFFEKHQRFGALCKIGDFGMARDAGSSEDGQEGDQKYMAPELLSSGVTHPSADIFSLGLTLYELASEIDFVMPSEGPRWHELRHGLQVLEIPASRSFELVQLVKHLLSPEQERRPTADTILSNSTVSAAGQSCDLFLRDYITDVEEFDRREEEKAPCQDETPRHGGRPLLYSPPMARLPPVPLTMHSPEFAPS